MKDDKSTVDIAVKKELLARIRVLEEAIIENEEENSFMNQEVNNLYYQLDKFPEEAL